MNYEAEKQPRNNTDLYSCLPTWCFKYVIYNQPMGHFNKRGVADTVPLKSYPVDYYFLSKQLSTASPYV